MKVKNIVFSGFAAAILAGVSGAHAADPVTPYNLATTEYVTKQGNLKQDKLSAENAAAPITISVDESGKATIGADLDEYATKQYITDSLSGDGVIADAVDQAIAKAVTDGTVGAAIEDAVADKQDKLTAGTDIEIVTTTDDQGNTVNTINSTVDLAPYATTESVTSITDALGGRIGTIENAGYQTAGDVTTALAPYATTETVAATYATKGEIEGLASETYAQQQATAAKDAAIADAAGKYATTGDLSAVSVVANAADALSKTNQSEINTLKTAGYQTAEQVSAKITAEAVTSVATGSANGTISVDGNDVPVYGLGSAAYTAADAYEQAGAAAAVQTAIDGAKYVSGKDVAAGTYLITTDGAGTYTWTSVKIVNE